MSGKIHIGPRGGEYRIKKGKRVYLSTMEASNSPKKKSPHRKLKAKTASHPVHKGVGKGGITRGWRAAAPHSQRDRSALISGCGNECFLLPKDKKFPVCPKCGGDVCTCRKDCRALKSAQIRARQFNYPRVATKAKKMYDELC